MPNSTTASGIMEDQPEDREGAIRRECTFLAREALSTIDRLTFISRRLEELEQEVCSIPCGVIHLSGLDDPAACDEACNDRNRRYGIQALAHAVGAVQAAAKIPGCTYMLDGEEAEIAVADLMSRWTPEDAAALEAEVREMRRIKQVLIDEVEKLEEQLQRAVQRPARSSAVTPKS